MKQIPDEELLTLIREAGEGDLRLFEELVRRYQGKVTTNCRYLSGSPDDAEDLAEEVFMKVYFGLAGFEGRSSFNTWVQRIKSNHCINFVKKRRLKTVEMDSSGVEAASGVPPEAEQKLEKEATKARVGRVLLQMSETLRIPLVLRDMDGMSYEEIAEEVGVGLSAVKMRIKRGREEFRRLIAAMDEKIPA
ncbi:MAG: sigma-70 family RNA polymerase sigma factor [Gemmatimonadota bacterium]